MKEERPAYGVNISGFIKGQFGLGEGVRSNIRSIKSANVPYCVNDLNIDMPKYIANSNDIDEHFKATNDYAINLVQANIDILPLVLKNVGLNYFEGKYNIGFWAWELENFPEESKTFFPLFNEIWVPSNFCAEAISKISPIPVIKFMHSIDIPTPRFYRKTFNLPENKFIFMTMFDYYSSIDRKNPIAVVDAYTKAFGKNNPDVLLVIKSSISKEFPNEKKALLEKIGDNSSIILIEEILEQEYLYSLMNCCDCFVSLHCSEGFGLTMAEAMYLEKPVIGTAYSSNMEFMNNANSYLVNFSLVKKSASFNYGHEDDYWAAADVDHAAQLMTDVFTNPEKAKKIAKQAKLDTNKILSPAVIGEKIKNRIDLIYNEIIPNLSDTKNKVSLLEFENMFLKQKLEKLKSYTPIKMKLAFKNLKNKLSGKNRKYIWED
ncbi:glycosyltransferase involved in cell wall biosynthesis [Sphingobacterium allocomposti]|uniref:Glycosyltransferase involved in cell wall biosynthesis n=1 Tax=Sphingobacterium allocomposti TaxID=415956 RepID=A0A5S5DA94_9SPHI|nr:glycosyltransferase [Sphingobacterium composti Yoo et al. 2007 non Ten et al. 2007]TYP92983.1 glycosyltransferase involved in cell wall biosynthesis [Sphingobacterium composti Yoo et al. 2007 non Ten et al. 2007]